MTTDELAAEWRYRYEERLGILCGGEKPTLEQEKIAHREADDAVERLKNEKSP